MLTGRLENPSEKEELLSALGDVLDGGLKWVNQSSSFEDFQKYLSGLSNADELQRYKERKFVVEHISLVTSYIGHMKSYFNILPLNEWNRHKTRIKMLIRFGHLKWKIIETFLAKVIRRCSQRKVVYRLEKLHKLLLMKGLKEDPTQLRETYATWLYSHGKYQECLDVTKQALESGKQWIVYQSLLDFQMFDISQSSYNDPQEIVDKFYVFTLTDVLINVSDDYAWPELFHLFEAVKRTCLWKQLVPQSFMASSKLEKERILPIYPVVHYRVLRSFCYLRLGEKTKAKEEVEAIKNDSFFCLEQNYYCTYKPLIVNAIKTFLSLMDKYYEKHENYSSSAFHTFMTGTMDSAILTVLSSKLDNGMKIEGVNEQKDFYEYPEDVASILNTSFTTLPVKL